MLMPRTPHVDAENSQHDTGPAKEPWHEGQQGYGVVNDQAQNLRSFQANARRWITRDGRRDIWNTESWFDHIEH
jgi:hypothetical protein